MRLLAQRRAAAKVWAFRKRTEDEAALIFSGHASRLARIGAPKVLVDLAIQAAIDERDHEARCLEVCEELDPQISFARPARTVASLGPPAWDDRRGALYTSVAACCITETLATALLIEIRKAVQIPLVHDTVSKILRDEVQHSRLGWAHLAWEASRSDVSWLSAFVPRMICASVAEETMPIVDEDLAAYGVLSRQDAGRVIDSALRDVISPGLAHFGVKVSSSELAA